MKLFKASKILHIVVLLCCFLPAIVPSCGMYPTKREIEEQEKAKQDSIAQIAAIDTLQIKSVDSTIIENKNDTAITADTVSTKNKVDTVTTKNKVKEDSMLDGILLLILSPDGKNLSIVGYTLNKVFGYCPVIFFLSLCWSIILRFKNSNHKLAFHLSLMGQIALTLFLKDNLSDVVWGFWVVYALSLFNAILNWRIYFEVKKNKLDNVWGDL
jgi:hypothetical protein